MPTYVIVLVVIAVLLALLALALARTSKRAQREYPKQPKGLSHDHEVGTGPAAPARDAEVLDFRTRTRAKRDD